MRKEIIIRMQLDSDKGRSKALKVAASVSGVESVTVAGSGKDLLVVIGDGVDAGELTRKLKKEVGHADIVELRTPPPPGSSPYLQRWPGEQSSQAVVSYYQHYYAPSPVAVAQGGYGYGYAGGGGLYAAEVARSHPVNYSPMIARHDVRDLGRPAATTAAAGGDGREHGSGGPNCCSIL
ncbi:unnamed protein product [Urochloa humidicola]